MCVSARGMRGIVVAVIWDFFFSVLLCPLCVEVPDYKWVCFCVDFVPGSAGKAKVN